MCFERDLLTYVCESGDPTVRILARVDDKVDVWLNGEELLELGDEFEVEVLDWELPDDVRLAFDEDGLLLDIDDTFPESWTS
jgi:hypothetical protein